MSNKTRHRRFKGDQQRFELSERIDDSLLPDADQIAEYAKSDPELPQFIRESAQKEQEFRHYMSKQAMKMGNREQVLQHGLNYFGMLCAIGIAFGGLWYSYHLLQAGHDIAGTIFSGAIIVSTVALFLRRKPPRPRN